jgi:site-specific recombinase XerD
MEKKKDKIKFYLERRKDNSGKIITKNVPVLLFFSFKGKRLQYFTGIRIDTEKWDAETMRVDEDQKEASRNNKILERLKRWVEEIADNANALGLQLTLEEFRNKLKERAGNTNPNKGASKTFIELYDEFIEVSKLSKKPGTIKALRTGYNNFVKFAKDTHTALAFDKINQEFYNKLLEYCFGKLKFKNNSTGKMIKDLKAFLNWATEEGYNSSLEFKKKGFKMLREEPEIIYLTYDELMLLYNHSFEEEHLENVKNVFCFGCFTGMRFSDITALTRENIHKDKLIYRITKTDEVNTIPLNSYTRAILEKYQNDEKPLPVISEQNTNLHVKEIARVIKLNRKIKITHFKGGERIVTVKALNKLITFHVSKKTFMTNFLSRGGSLETAMAITGNKDYRTAKRYFKVVDTLKADEMNRVFGK